MVHVLCFGNLLHGDDGFGIHVHRLLAARLDPLRTRLIEVGVRGIDALGLLHTPSHVVLVDALRDPEMEPGTVCVIDGNRVEADTSAPLHGGDAAWLMQAMRASLRPVPTMTLVGAVVGAILPFEARLSSNLASRLELVADQVERLVREFHG